MVVSLLVGGTASAQAPGWVVRGQDAAVGADEGDGLAAVVGAHAVPRPRVVAAAAANVGGVGRCGHRSTPARSASRCAASTYGGYELAIGTRASRSSRVARA